MANHDPQWLSNLFLGSVCCRILTQRGVSQIAAGFCPSINGELWRGRVALQKYGVLLMATDSKRWPSWDCANPLLFWRVQCSPRILPSNSNKSLSGRWIISLSFDSSVDATSGYSVFPFFCGDCCFFAFSFSQSRNVVVSPLTGSCLRERQEIFQLAFITDRVKISFNGFGPKAAGRSTKCFIWNIFSLPATHRLQGFPPSRQ